MVTMQMNQTPTATVDGKVAKKAPKSILQPKPKYNLKPALVSPEKRESAVQEEESIPITYVETIQKGFGENTDIFKDVLKVSRDAPSRDVRIAYFRRGREVLAEGGFRTLDQAATVSDVSTLVRTRFQAVSMAYEIASCARWKNFYLQHGFAVAAAVADDTVSVDSGDLVLGSTASLPGNNSKPAVRWNGQVEEMLFEKEPGERKQPAKKIKKKNTRVVVESGHLDEHLQKLDEEASQHFVTDFWDSLEESLDGLLRMARPQNKKSRKDDSETSMEAKGSFNSNASPKPDDDRSVQSDETPFDEDPIVEASPAISDPVAKSVETKIAPTKKGGPSPFRPISPDVSKSNDGEVFDVDSITFSADDLTYNASTSAGKSDSPSFENLQNKSQSRAVKPEPSGVLKDDDDVFFGIDVDDDYSESTPVDATGETPDECSRMDAPRHIAVLRVRSESPITVAFSELTETVASSYAGKISDDDESAASEESRDADAPSNGILDFADKCDSMLDAVQIMGSLGLTTYSKAAAVEEKEKGDESVESNLSKKEDGFVEYLVAYINAIVNDCAGKISSISEIDWDDTVLGAFMVDDSGMAEMLSTLETEMKKAPAIDAVEVITSPPFEAIEAVRSFG
jgi:hypothetical protein